MSFRRIVLTILFLLPLPAFAHIIGITATTPFPSEVSVFSMPVTASFLVTNISERANFIAVDKSELPAGINISANNCGNVLTPGQSCSIQLTLNILNPASIATALREWAKPTADGVQYPINLQVTSMKSGLLFAGAANGNVYLSANNGAGWTPTQAAPNNGNAINCVAATDNFLYACSGNNIFYSANGSAWTESTSPDGSRINSISIAAGKIVVGTADGNVFSTTNNGSSWTAAAAPDGSSVGSVYLTATNDLYAGTNNGNVYHSVNNGATWTALSTIPDGTAITSVYAVGTTVYALTANEYLYTNTNNASWNLFAQTVFSLFVSADGSIIDAGSQSGFVYSLVMGDKLGFVANTPINGLFQLS